MIIELLGNQKVRSLRRNLVSSFFFLVRTTVQSDVVAAGYSVFLSRPSSGGTRAID